MSILPEIQTFLMAHVVSLGFACHALLTKRDPRSALGWTVVLIFLPIAGLAVYLIFGIGRAQSRAEKIMRKIAHIEQHYPQPVERPGNSLDFPEAICLERLGRKLTSCPISGGNKITPLHNGDEAYPAMIEAINNARERVYLGSYIFNYGHAAKEFINALEKAHLRGLEVRVLVDGIGALYSWRKPWRILKNMGIKTTRFRPPRLFPPNFGINLRSHRKVLVCDDIGFTGGMNIADGDLIKLHPDGKHCIQDMQFRFEGPIVNQLRRAFLLNWAFCTGGDIIHLPALPNTVKGNSFCRVVVDGPGNDGDAILDIICGAINLARKRIRIMTPYFLPPQSLMSAIYSAGQRGVDVRVILPAKNNLGYVNWAMERIIPALLRCGVRFWYQKPPFAHTKLLAVDDFFTFVGSANLDSRSLLLNFELNMEIYDMDFNQRMVDFMDMAIAQGSEIHKHYFQNMSIIRRLRNSASWIFSPYF